jgi:predicted ATPase
MAIVSPSRFGKRRDRLAELLRRLGVLLEERDPPTRAMMFREAGRVAQRQGATFRELRAASDLARRLAADRRQGDAREVLLPVYRRFNKGFVLPDLVAAAALARELG